MASGRAGTRIADRWPGDALLSGTCSRDRCPIGTAPGGLRATTSTVHGALHVMSRCGRQRAQALTRAQERGAYQGVDECKQACFTCCWACHCGAAAAAAGSNAVSAPPACCASTTGASLEQAPCGISTLRHLSFRDGTRKSRKWTHSAHSTDAGPCSLVDKCFRQARTVRLSVI